MISYEVGDLVLLNTVNLKSKGISGKLRKKFIGPFRIIERIGTQSYRVELPQECKIHNVFHVSILKFWNENKFVQEPSNFEVDELEVPDETMYEVERVLRYKKQKRKNKMIWEFLTRLGRFPLEDASWEPESNFSDLAQLQEDINLGLNKFDS